MKIVLFSLSQFILYQETRISLWFTNWYDKIQITCLFFPQQVNINFRMSSCSQKAYLCFSELDFYRFLLLMHKYLETKGFSLFYLSHMHCRKYLQSFSMKCRNMNEVTQKFTIVKYHFQKQIFWKYIYFQYCIYCIYGESVVY